MRGNEDGENVRDRGCESGADDGKSGNKGVARLVLVMVRVGMKVLLGWRW